MGLHTAYVSSYLPMHLQWLECILPIFHAFKILACTNLSHKVNFSFSKSTNNVIQIMILKKTSILFLPQVPRSFRYTFSLLKLLQPIIVIEKYDISTFRCLSVPCFSFSFFSMSLHHIGCHALVFECAFYHTSLHINSFQK